MSVFFFLVSYPSRSFLLQTFSWAYCSTIALSAASSTGTRKEWVASASLTVRVFTGPCGWANIITLLNCEDEDGVATALADAVSVTSGGMAGMAGVAGVAGVADPVSPDRASGAGEAGMYPKVEVDASM